MARLTLARRVKGCLSLGKMCLQQMVHMFSRYQTVPLASISDADGHLDELKNSYVDYYMSQPSGGPVPITEKSLLWGVGPAYVATQRNLTHLRILDYGGGNGLQLETFATMYRHLDLDGSVIVEQPQLADAWHGQSVTQKYPIVSRIPNSETFDVCVLAGVATYVCMKCCLAELYDRVEFLWLLRVPLNFEESLFLTETNHGRNHQECIYSHKEFEQVWSRDWGRVFESRGDLLHPSRALAVRTAETTHMLLKRNGPKDGRRFHAKS